MTGVRSEEFRGKTVDAAISAGLAALGISRDQAVVEVVRPGSRGVLGIGAEDAIVRITVASRARPESEPSPKSDQSPVAPSSLPAMPDLREEPARVQRSPSRPSTPRKETWSPSVPVTSAQPKALAQPQVDLSDKDMAIAEQGREVLMGLLERMNVSATIEIVPQSDAEADEGDQVPVLNVVGDDLGALIGRQNEVILALELVTRLMVNQKSHTHSSFVVDVNGYRARRAESLRRLALRMADQAAQAGRTMALEPMPPAERRIIHLTLRDHPSVTTQSVGEGDRRKVTVIPKKA